MASNRSYTNGTPTTYGHEKHQAMLARKSGDMAGFLRPMIPIAFPGCDPVAMLDAIIGFSSFSGTPRDAWTENTTEGVLEQSFHEVGPGQVPAGPRNGPAPNPDPNAANNAYGALAGTDLVKRCINEEVAGPNGTRVLRGATMVHNAWKTAHKDSCAVWLANLRRDDAAIRSTVRAHFPGAEGAENGWSTWRVFLMFTSFSRGPGGAYARVSPYLARLVETPEDQRLLRLCALVDADLTAGRSSIGTTKGKGGTCYGIIRSLQKLYSGKFLAEATGGNVGWFGGCTLDAQLEDRITRTAYGVSLASIAHAAVEHVTNLASVAAQTATDGGVGSAVVGGVMLVGAVVVGSSMMKG